MITDDQTRANIAANIQRLLRARGWTQMQLAGACQHRQATISRILNELRMPSAVTLARIAEALDVTIDRLVMDPPEKISEKSPKSA